MIQVTSEALEVESVAVGGDGVARQESGRVVFLPRTAPGDRVRARITEEHGSWARGGAEEVLEPGPDGLVDVNACPLAEPAVDEAWLDAVIAERSGRGEGGTRILDLYAGAGARAIRWALEGAEVAACEIATEAVRDGREAASRAGAPVDFRAAPVEDALADLLPADVAVVNPPRAGLARPVAGALAGAPLDGLAYVSCDPATLARDLDRLGDRWRVEALRAFDAFPQTAHVETVAWMVPR